MNLSIRFGFEQFKPDFKDILVDLIAFEKMIAFKLQKFMTILRNL